eukprot:Pgem_evm1s7875
MQKHYAVGKKSSKAHLYVIVGAMMIAITWGGGKLYEQFMGDPDEILKNLPPAIQKERLERIRAAESLNKKE